MTTVRSQRSLASSQLRRSSRPEDVVALADGGQRPRRVVRVGADEQVDAGAPDLLPLAELVELGARRDQHLAGPVADFGEEDAGGLAVGEVDADGLAVMGVEARRYSGDAPSTSVLSCRRPNASLAELWIERRLNRNRSWTPHHQR